MQKPGDLGLLIGFGEDLQMRKFALQPEIAPEAPEKIACMVAVIERRLEGMGGIRNWSNQKIGCCLGITEIDTGHHLGMGKSCRKQNGKTKNLTPRRTQRDFHEWIAAHRRQSRSSLLHIAWR